MKLNTKSPNFAFFMVLLGILSVFGGILVFVDVAVMLVNWRWQTEFPYILAATTSILTATFLLDRYDGKQELKKCEESNLAT